jgi:hypothetical protein
MVEPLTLLSNNALKTMKALFCKGLKLSGNKPLVLGSIKETEEPIWIFRSFYGQLVVKSQVNRQRNRKFLKLLKPNPSLLINLSLLLIPSTGPLVVLLSK